MAIESLRDLRRQQIVAAARRIVAEEGLEALTFGTLEAKVPFTRGVITHHFANKDDIVDAVLASAIEEIDAGTRAGVASGDSAEAKLRAVLEATIRGFVRHREATRILVSFWGRIPASPRIRALNAALYARYRADAARIVRSGKRRGELADVPPDAVAAVLVGIVIGVAAQAYFDEGAIDVEKVTAEAQQMALARLRAGSGAR